MSIIDSFDSESLEVLKRALEYYLKSLRTLEELEESSGNIPLIENQVETSLEETNLIKRLLGLGLFNDLNKDEKKLLFLIRILNFYKNELLEDLEELEITNNDKSEIDLLESEIDNVEHIIQSF